MRDRSYLLKQFYWRRMLYRAAVRSVIRPALAIRGLPLVAVTGTNGKTTVTLLVRRIFEDAGHRAAGSTTDGIWIGRRWIHNGDQAGAKGLWRANLDPRVRVLVAETARGGLLRSGPGFSACDVSIVTNVHENHLGSRGIDTLEAMAGVKAMLPRLTRASGVAVLNYDQELVREMARVTEARVTYYTLGEPADSVAECFFLRDGFIHRKRGATCEPVISTERVFLTHGGAVTFQIANVMAALAAVEALEERLQVPRASLEKTLATFGRAVDDVPGRLQLFRYRGADVLLSATKNPSTYADELPIIRRLATARGYQRIVGILTEVGNRGEDHYRNVSRVVGELLDEVVCVAPGPRYLRGRSGEEIVGMLEAEIPSEKLIRPRDRSFDGIVASAASAAEPVLFVSLCAFASGSLRISEVLEHGEPLALRVDA